MFGEGSPGDRCIEESQLWSFPNSDSSGGGGGGEENLGMKPPSSGSGSLSMREKEKRVLVGQKPSRNGVLSSGKGSSGGGKGGESEHEIHIWTERERRKKMRNMFSNLHALLPQLPPKADKSTIVDEAVKYIETLQHTLQTLEQQRLGKLQSATIIDCEPSIITSPGQAFESREALLANQGSTDFSMNMSMPHSLPVPLSPACFQTWFSPNVVVNMCGDDAHISVCSLRKPGLLTTIVYILEKHKLEVVSAHVSSDHYRSMYMIHAHAGGTSDQFPDALSVEEIFKLAVGEMNLWLLSC